MLKSSRLFAFLFLLYGFTSYSQFKDKNVLMTIDGETVLVDEFLRVYNKNLDMVQDENQKDKAAYLELFVNYKLKTKEAMEQDLHKNPEFQKELSGYEEQLSQNYLYEQEITESLIREAYDRMQEEVNANHILIMLEPNATPEDTLVAYNKIKNIRDEALRGEDFEELAKKHSEEPNAAERGGALGYFKGFGMVYPFENAAYNTPKGQISDIVRTQFGYHILKVNDRRPVPAEVTVAHIMISTRNELSEEEAKQRIEEIHQRVKQGEDFEELARQFSEDPGSSQKGGVLNRFGSGRLNSPDFEQAAFALQNPGEVSEPVKTDFGWHIIKLIERHERTGFEDSKQDILKRIKSSDRSKVIVASINDRIKEKYGFTVVESPLPFFNTFVTDSILKRKWDYSPEEQKLKNTLFKIGDQEYTFGDFASFLKEKQKRGRVFKDKEELLKNYYDEFELETLKDFFKLTLKEENQEYAALLSEYRDGLLIYELMQQSIWEPSKNDSLGLVNFFEKNKDKYRWETRIEGVIASTGNENIAGQIKKLLESGASQSEIRNKFNTEDSVQVIFTEGVYEMGNSILPADFKPEKGVSKVFSLSDNKNNTNNSQFIVIQVDKVIPPATKSLQTVRGKVINDYQSYLESEWMKELRTKYQVKINKKAISK